MEYVKLEKKDHIAVVTMSYPPVNVLSFDMLDELSDVFSGLEKDENIWAAVLCSDQKIFAAGADLKSLRTAGSAANYETSSRMQKVFLQIENYPHPVICAVHGSCMGGGLEMALSCDLRVFDAKVKAAFPECGFGIGPGAGGTQRLTKLTGVGRAKRLIYTGEVLTAQSALELGICEYVADEGRALEKALEVAEKIVSKGPKGVAAAKKCIEYAADHPLADGLVYENKTISALFDTEDKAEGIAAFFEKRTPQFRNK